jgi:hypothetical protein
VGVSYAPQKLPLAHETHFKNMETIQTNLVTDVRQRVTDVRQRVAEVSSPGLGGLVFFCRINRSYSSRLALSAT